MPDWDAQIETALARERAAGRMARQAGDELQRRLALLAFNMTGAGCMGAAPKAAVASWLLHLQHKRLGSYPHAAPGEQAFAAKWWAAGIALGLLREAEDDSIAFAEHDLQVLLCLRFCAARPLDAKLLRLMVAESFREVWRRWARQDPTLAERLTVPLLGNEQTKGCAHAATILRALGAPQAVERLVAALDAPHKAVRIRAAQALRVLEDPRAIALLAAQLKRESPPAHIPVIEVLEAYGLPTLPLFLTLLGRWDTLVILAGGKQADYEVALRAIEALGALGEPAIPMLVRLRKHPDGFGVGPAVLRALGATGSPQAVAPLIQMLGQHTGGGAAINALVTLGAIAVPALIEALGSKNAWLYKNTAAALSRTHDVHAAAPLLHQLKRHRSDLSSAWFGDALVELRALGSADLLAEALTEPDATVRLYAACALAELGDSRAVEPLRRLSQEESQLFRLKAENALWKLGRQQAPEALLQDISDLIRQKQLQAVFALSKLDDPRSLAALVTLLQTGDANTCFIVAQALAHMGTQEALEALRQAQRQRPPSLSGGVSIQSAITQLSRLLDKK